MRIAEAVARKNMRFVPKSGTFTGHSMGGSWACSAGIPIPTSSSSATRRSNKAEAAGIDYLMTRFTNPFTSTNNQSNFRYTAGIVFTLDSGAH
jgi:hypothetical protein